MTLRGHPCSSHTHTVRAKMKVQKIDGEGRKMKSSHEDLGGAHETT